MNFSVQKSYRSIENSFIGQMNSYETHGSTPRLLPLPKDIHDYIDDFLEISETDIPTMYYNPYDYSF